MKKVIIGLGMLSQFYASGMVDSNLSEANVDQPKGSVIGELSTEAHVSDDTDALLKRLENLKKNLKNGSTLYEKLESCSYLYNKNDENAEKLLQLLHLENGNKPTEVRFVNAESMIKSYKLPRDKEQAFLKLLGSESSLMNDFNEYFSFENEKLRNDVLTSVEIGCAKSKIFRDLMVCYLALSQSNLLLSPDGNSKVAFKRSDRSHCDINSGNVYLSGKAIGFRSYFKGDNACTLESPYIFGMANPIERTLFHECGHAVGKNFNKLSYSVSDSDSYGTCVDYYNIISNFLPTSLNIEYLQKKEAFSIPSDEKYEMDSSPSAAFRTQRLLSDPGEIWQILGLAYVATDEKNILYINKLSDLTLSLSSAIPIRIDHLGMSEDEESMFPPDYIKVEPFNPELYDTLFKLHGTSLRQYQNKLAPGLVSRCWNYLKSWIK